MKSDKRVVLSLAIFVLAGMLTFGVVRKHSISLKGGGSEKTYADSEVLAKFKPGVGLAAVRGFARARGLTLKKQFGLLSKMNGGQLVLLKSKQKIDAKILARKLSRDPRLQYAHPNYRRYPAATPNDTRFSEVWGLHNTGQTGGTADADIDAPEAWEISTGSRDVIVAVIDTGLDYEHDDLKHNCWKNPGEIAGNGIDDDGNGYVDDIYGIDPAGTTGSGSDPDSDPMDGYGHGTHCAGSIGARGNNALGIVGVNWDVRIMGLKFFDDAGGNGYDAFSIECIQYAVYQKTHGQNVVAINASWGGYSSSGDPGPNADALRDAIEVATNAGIVFCAAAGNGDGAGDGAGDNNDSDIHHYPSDYTLPGIISVAATDHNDALGDFSNYGPTSVDMGAPGVAILSSVPRAYVPNAGDVFFDDMESGVGNWSTSGTNNTWAITDEYEVYFGGDYPSCPSPTRFWSDSPGSGGGANYTMYVGNTDSYLTYNADIDLSGYAGQDVYLGLSAGYHIARRDYVYLEISNDSGANWTQLYNWSNTDGSIYFWHGHSWEIPEAYKTANFRMRFNLASDRNNNGIGIVLDDIGIVTSKSSPYESWNGTSMATPHVAGAVAWLASVYPDETVAQRKERLLYGGDAKPALSGTTVSGRRLNLMGAYNYAPASGPAITVTSPDGGEVLTSGGSHDITWTTTGTVGNVDVDYSVDGGLTWTSIVTNTANDGTYSWIVPSVTAANCLVRIYENSDRDPSDTSDEVFSIVQSTTETVSTPTSPSGPTTGIEGGTYTYTTGGSTSSLGHSVQYRFDWGDGTLSSWLPVGTTSASHSWAGGGTYNIRAMARCSIHYVQSAWSTAASLTLADSPTWAAISHFGACTESTQPTLEWHTNTEVGVAGFNLWRRSPKTKEFSRINDKLLPALPGAAGGAVYRYADPGADPGGDPLVYQLEEIDARGRSLMYGPFVVHFAPGAWKDGLEQKARITMEIPTGIYGFRRFERGRSEFEQQRLRAPWADEPPSVAMAGATMDRVRITVKGRGLFYVSAARIAVASGLPESRVREKIRRYNLNLTTRGRKVAWLADRDYAGLYFYNQGQKSLYFDKNVFYLEKDFGLGMETVAAGGVQAGADDRFYGETLHFEENHYPLLIASMDPAEDIWFWDYVAAGQSPKTFPLHVPGVAGSGNARLTIELQGATDTPAAQDHHAVVFLNGREIGDAAWSGAKNHAFEMEFDASLLEEGANTVSVSGTLDTGAPYSTFYVDSFDLDYPRFYRAEENTLICRENGDPTITVSGVTDPGVMVLDLRNPRKPVYLAGVAPDVMGRVSFASGSAEGTYLVCGSSAALRPIAVEGDTLPGIKAEARSSEYIVITPRAFAGTAQNLANLRRNRGLRALTVTLEDIYATFNYGEPSPFAIRDFLADTYKNGRGNQLKYVVLAGKGTYDYNDYMGYGDNRMPVLLARTPQGLCAADSIFGDVIQQDGLPEIAIGRLPAVTQTELKAMIKKIRYYEIGQGEWTGKALFIADNNDNGGDFTGGSNLLATLAEGMTMEKVFHDGAADQTRARINAAWEQGVGWVNYCGHGGIRNLTQEDVFNNSDATALRNGEQLPLTVMWACAAGRFELPGFTSLGESLLLNPLGGMAGGLLPSGAAMHSDSMYLARLFYNSVFRAGKENVGKALLAAMQKYVNQGGDASLFRIYNWLGDPAMGFK